MDGRIPMPPPGVPFVDLATVDSVSIETHGILCELTVQPAGWKVRARLLQVYTGVQRGMIVVPRPGDEVIVLFPGGMPDSAVAIWGLYNGVDQTPGDGDQQLILIEGRDGDHLRVRIRGRADITIDHDLATDVGGSRELEVGGDSVTRIHGEDIFAVDGDSMILCQGSSDRTVLRNELDSVLGSRARTTGLTDTETVAGIKSVNAAILNVNVLTSILLTHGGVPIMTYNGSEFTFLKKVNFAAGTEGDRT